MDGWVDAWMDGSMDRWKDFGGSQWGPWKFLRSWLDSSWAPWKPPRAPWKLISSSLGPKKLPQRPSSYVLPALSALQSLQGHDLLAISALQSIPKASKVIDYWYTYIFHMNFIPPNHPTPSNIIAQFQSINAIDTPAKVLQKYWFPYTKNYTKRSIKVI